MDVSCSFVVVVAMDASACPAVVVVELAIAAVVVDGDTSAPAVAACTSAVVGASWLLRLIHAVLVVLTVLLLMYPHPASCLVSHARIEKVHLRLWWM